MICCFTANPKSPNLYNVSFPYFFMKTLSGLISLCTTFLFEIKFNPKANWYAIYKAYNSVKGPLFEIISSKLPSGQN